MDAVLNSEATLDCGNRPICVLDKTLNLSVHSHRRNENNDSYLRTFLLVQWLRLGVSSAGCLGLIPAQAMRWASLVAQRLKRLPAMRETWVRSLGREDPPGEGNGNPLQYRCLENPMDGEAWWATVHGVTKSRTQLSDFTSL